MGSPGAGKLLAMLLLPLAWVTLCAAHPKLDRAKSYLLAGDRAKARHLLDSLLTQSHLEGSEQSEAAYLRARLSEDAGDLERRLRVYLNSSGRAAEAGGASLLLGRHAFAKGEIQEALGHFLKAKSDGRGEEGSLWAGLAASILNEFSQAEELLEQAASSGNANIRQRAWMALGGLAMRRHQWQRASSYYERVREDPVRGPGWWSSATLNLASCQENMGGLSQANALRKELLDSRPQGYETPFIRARAALEATPESTSTIPTEFSGYALQVGAFSRREGAQSLADTLSFSGVAKVRVSVGEDLFRVFVEGFGTREEAESAGDSLSAVFGLGYSVRTPPSEP